MPAAGDVLVQHLLDGVELVPQQREPDARAEEPEPEALEGELESPLLEPAGTLVVASVRVRDRFDEQRARVPDARRVEVLGDEALDDRGALLDRRPLAHQLLHLELHRDRVDSVMGREPPRELGMRADEPQRLLKAADERARRDQFLVDLRLVVGICDLGQQVDTS